MNTQMGPRTLIVSCLRNNFHGDYPKMWSSWSNFLFFCGVSVITNTHFHILLLCAVATVWETMATQVFVISLFLCFCFCSSCNCKLLCFILWLFGCKFMKRISFWECCSTKQWIYSALFKNLDWLFSFSLWVCWLLSLLNYVQNAYKFKEDSFLIWIVSNGSFSGCS